jgi:predicted  nucleic acid-binding Zn-ribbon protein
MSDTNARPRAHRRATGKLPNPVEAPSPSRELAAPSRELAAARAKAAREIAALVRLTELDAAPLAGDAGRREGEYDEVADERHGLGARLSPEVLEAYDRAMRGGRRPAVVSLVASVCSGCHVRLHSTLEQKIRRRRGVAPCPHCLRLVYDPAWLAH